MAPFGSEAVSTSLEGAGAATAASSAAGANRAEAEGEIPPVFETRGVQDRAMDIAGRDALQLFRELRHGEILAGNQAPEDRILVARTLEDGTPAARKSLEI